MKLKESLRKIKAENVSKIKPAPTRLHLKFSYEI
jgi:hypothetical protein